MTSNSQRPRTKSIQWLAPTFDSLYNLVRNLNACCHHTQLGCLSSVLQIIDSPAIKHASGFMKAVSRLYEEIAMETEATTTPGQ